MIMIIIIPRPFVHFAFFLFILFIFKDSQHPYIHGVCIRHNIHE